MENHNVSTSNILLETLGDDIPITLTLSTPTKNIAMENKDSAPTTPCDNQVPLETELTALKSFVLEQFFLIKKLIQEIKDPNHEVANSTYVAILLEQIEYLKEENKGKNSIIQSLTNQYNIFSSTTTYNSNNNNDNNSNTNNNDHNNNNENNNNNNNNLHKTNNLPNTSNNKNIDNFSNNSNNNFSSIKCVSNNNNNNKDNLWCFLVVLNQQFVVNS